MEDKDKLIAELKAENERLKKVAFQSQNAAIHINQQADKYLRCLQEIKAIAETGMHCEGMGCDFMPKILDIITKAEGEG